MAATKAERISRPSSVRMGMFCRLGSLELRRPVAATTWLNEAWTRPVFGWISVGQRVDVGALELGELAVLDDLGRERMWSGEFFEDVGVGAGAGLGFLDDRQPQLVEQDFRELLGRVDVERVAGELFDLLFELLQPLAVPIAELAETVASTLMPLNSRSARTSISGTSIVSLSSVEAVAWSRSSRMGVHAQRDVGVFGGVFADWRRRGLRPCVFGFCLCR